MKIKDGFIVRKVVDTYVVVAVGENLTDFSAMITLNETGAFLWNSLQTDKTAQQLTEELCAEYDITAEVAASDIDEFLATLDKHNLIEE